ncbi:hypothetical protein QII23_gp4 [ssRNA phage SRR5466365_1]|uniref:Uncharacterized protein n=1 Tax=ssRNA phage SRR5466365_1 TaxID=2786400 RepID=A0A8S5KYF4_9VIRU|nr:hypothetical protein QII23_gp4 [ssRNA phage SRR5466365_1]DAD50806.1 TPA_asm: hypothetical protein [ssRNA phage SRR5466365_1]
MVRNSRDVVGFMGGVFTALLAFGLVYVVKTLATCSCLNG